MHVVDAFHDRGIIKFYTPRLTDHDLDHIEHGSHTVDRIDIIDHTDHIDYTDNIDHTDHIHLKMLLQYVVQGLCMEVPLKFTHHL